MPDVFSDAQFTLYGDVDSTKNVKFDVDAQVGANQTRVITVPNKNITLDDAGDSRAPSSHTHGNLTNDGKIGTTANLPLRTGTNGVVEAGSFGTAAGSFCAGDDARLSDDRDPNAHAASHLPDGADEIFDQDLNTADSPQFAGLALNSPSDGEILRIEGNGIGDVGFAIYNNTGDQANSFYFNKDNSYIGIGVGASRNYIQSSLPVDVGAELAVAGPIDITGASASTHKATTRTNLGAAASGSITSSGLTQSTARILGRTSASAGAIEEIQIGTGLSLSAGELSATGSGITAVGASTADVLSVSGSDLVADDPNADRIVFWDDSESKLRYLEAGTGLSISGTTLTATATGTIGGGTGSTDNSILRSDGTGGSTLQDSAFVIADNATASPNNTVNHASIQATGGSTNVSVSIVPKGTGSISAQVPDATTTGGNTRGVNATDFQRVRGNANQVASGERSFLAGGVNNIASGTNAFVGGSNDSTASGTSSCVIGSWSGTASSNRTTVIASYQSTASAEQTAVICGRNSSATLEGALAIGRDAVSNLQNMIAEGAGAYNAQHVRFSVYAITTTNSAVELLGGAGSNRLRCPSGKAMFMNIKIVGVSNGGGTVATFERQYAIKNVGGTTSQIYAPVEIGTDNAASTSITISADDTNDAVKIEATGLSATTIRWCAHVSAVEITHG
jgi:hypothetical protein